MFIEQEFHVSDDYKFDLTNLIDNSDNQSTKENEYISYDGIKDNSFIQQNIDSIMFPSKSQPNLFNGNEDNHLNQKTFEGTLEESFNFNKPKEVLFITKTKKKPVREAIEKKFRANCLSHIINKLNHLSGKKYHFYKLNYLEFTMKPQRQQNRIWFKWTLEEILSVFGKKQKGGSNLKTINTIKQEMSSIPHYNEIMFLLNKSFREIINDYCHSEDFTFDLNKISKEKRLIYAQLGSDSELSYINITLDGKEN